MSESDVQVAPDSTGAKVKTFKVVSPTAVDASGNAQADTALHQQVVSLATARGDDLRLDAYQRAVLLELQAMRELLEAISLKLE